MNRMKKEPKHSSLNIWINYLIKTKYKAFKHSLVNKKSDKKKKNKI